MRQLTAATGATTTGPTATRGRAREPLPAHPVSSADERDTART